MKTYIALSACAALLLAPLTSTRAQTWTNVFGGVPGVCGDIGADAAGNVYAAGRYIADNGSSVAVVQRSGDGGNSWELMDQYAEPGLNYAHNRAFAAAPAGAPPDITGHLFAGGNLNNLLPNGTYEFNTLWHIREWNPVTGVWTTADDASALDVGETSCADILVTPSGDVYATGGGGPGWVVRKRAANAATFTTVYPDSTGQTSGGSWDMAYHPVYGVFVVGEANGIWTVLGETGNAGSWATVNTFKTTEWTKSSATAIVTTSSGAVHVAGRAYSSKTRKYHWMVRSSYDGGATWTVSDTYSYGGSTVNVSCIVEDAAGNLLVSGSVTDSAGKLWWLVRKGVPGTKRVKQGGNWVTVPTVTWTNSDLYQLVAGQPAQANGITIANGNIFVGGSAANAAGVNQLIVRKLPAQ